MYVPCVCPKLSCFFVFFSKFHMGEFLQERNSKKKEKGAKEKGSTSTNQTSLKINQFFLNSKTIEHNSVICFNHIIFSLKVSNHMGGRFFFSFFFN